MNDIIGIIDFITKKPEDIVAMIPIVAFVLLLTIAFYTTKDRLWYYITHCRNKTSFIALVIIVVLIWAGQHYFGLSFGVILILTLMWCFLLAVRIMLFKPRTQFNSLYLKKYKKYLDDGVAIEYSDFFEAESHWFLLDIADKIEYKILRAIYYMEVNDYEKAYKIYCSIENRYLYDDEVQDITYSQAIVLVMMGNMYSAKQLLGNPKNNKSINPFVWITYSFVLEQDGRMEEALEYAKKARAISETNKISDYRMAQIISDYARMTLICGNKEEARKYYAIAYEKVQNCDNIRILHPIAMNYIVRTAVDKNKKEEALAILADYKNRIKTESVINLIEYENCALIVYRQFGYYKEEYNTIKNYFPEILCKLKDKNQSEFFKASTFRMLMNGCYEIGWFDNYIYGDKSSYDSLELMTKLAIFKEYMGIMQQDKFRVLRQREPYRSLFDTIMDYYQGLAISDIEQEERRSATYNIFKQKILTENKLFIYKLIQGKDHIALSTGLYMNHYQTLLNAGLRIEALCALILYIDECSSPANILIMMPHWKQPRLYSDFIENATPPPFPDLAADGIHVNYYSLIPRSGFAIIPLRKERISKNIEIAKNEWHRIAEHPAKIDIGIHLAHMLMALDRREEAREFFLFYKKSGIEKNQLADWIKNEVIALDLEFRNEY